MATLDVRVRMVEGSMSVASGRGHAVVVDRPVDKGGTDLGFLGGELLLASEGGCFLSNLVAAAKAREIRLDRVDVMVRGTQADAPPRFAAIALDVVIESDASDEEIAKLLQIAERGCIVSNTLRQGTELTVARA
ncbi:MAG: OsmC family protein [Thermomicrobiales bacterium]